MVGVIGQTYYMLGHKLKNETKEKIKATVNTRVFEPMRQIFANKAVPLAPNWYKIGSNWNAVCWSGVTVAALTLLDNEADRQTFLNQLLVNGKSYWDSFADDGYPSEGVGYFNYGVAPYIATRQIVMEATVGTTDLFAIDPRIPQNAISCIEYPMSSVVMAHFGDDKFTVSFDPGSIDYILSTFDKKNSASFNNSFVTVTFLGEIVGYTLIYGPNYRYKYQTPIDISYGMNKYYNISGIMVSRPTATPTSAGLAVTIKLLGFRSDGGHSHNDAGSYSIALNGVNVAGEIGGPEFYTADTFSSKRYSFMLMNSYGHPVPSINGKNQSTNYLLKKNPVVLSQSTNSSFDKIVYDLKNCYEEAPEIKSLTRAMTYNRSPTQNVIIEDEASFNTSSTFEVAITSKGDWVQQSISADCKTVQGTLTYSNQILKVTITATDPISIEEVAYNEFGNAFTRVAVKTANKVTYAKIATTFNA